MGYKDIAFKKAVIYLPVGYSTNIDQYFEYTPYNASGSPFEIYVHEDGIVTYDGNGYIYGLKKGSTNVTVTSEGKSSTALFVVGNYAYWIDTDQRDFNLKPGDTCTLEYRLSPEGGDISDESPVWKVDSMYPEGCIEFDGKGNVKAVSPGYAYVNVSIAVGHSVTYYINVLAEPEDISFTKKTYYFPADYSVDVDMYLEYEPYTSKGTPITVTSSDSSVVRVENKRLYTAGRGTAKVTVKTENNKTAEADFVVGNYATGIGFSGQSSFRLRSGEEATLEYSLWPRGGNFSDDEVSWRVIGEGTVISFDETTRKVKALEAGTGYVKVKTKSGYELTYNIYVVKEPQKVSLDNSMKLALVGLGWDTNRYDGGYDFDLDASAFLLGDNGKLQRDEDFIFYNNLESRNKAVVHTGDNLTGDGDGDDEVIMIEKKNQNFGQVSNAYIRIVKMADEFDTVGEPVLKFDLEEEFSIETALVVAEIYLKNGEWKFSAVAAGYQGGLEAIVRSFGGNV